MNSDRIYDALTNIRDEYITEAREHKLKKTRVNIMRFSAIAASIIIVLGIGSYILMNGNLPPAPGGTAGGAGHSDNSTVFMSYAGPVFPLSIPGNVDGIAASRDITFDFSTFGKTKETANGLMLHQSDINITDSYTLTNTSADDQTVQILYPFAGSFSELQKLLPVIFVNDATLKTKLLAGKYSGGFTGVGDDNTTHNLAQLDSWEKYTELLSGGEYMDKALGSTPELNQTVTVYEFQNMQADHDAAINPTLAATFTLDYNRTTVLTYGFHGASFDSENGFMLQCFSVPREGDSRYGQHFYLIIVGDDINDFNTQGYKNGGCNDGEEMDGVSADITRYEAKLGDMLELLLDEYMTQYHRGRAGEAGYTDDFLDKAMLYRAAAEMLCDYGVLNEKGVDRYDRGWLDDIFSESLVMDRVFYLTAEITIPAGESIGIRVDMVKPGSFDFYGSGSDNMGVYGYDMLTKLGSNLTFGNVTAELAGADQVEIVRQNFGFDPANNVLEVTLDAETLHYYIEVRGAVNEG